MWLNAVAGAVLALCVAAGAWSGALATGLRLAAFVLAYAAAVMLGPRFAPAIGEPLGLHGPLAVAVSGAAAFVLANLVLAVASRIVRRLGRRTNKGRTARDRVVGATFGAVRGALLALLIVYAAMWADALRATGTAVVPEVGDSLAAKITSGVVERAIETAVDTSDPGARLTARMASDPAVYAAELQSVVDDPAVAQLRADAQFWTDVEQGDVDAALRSPSFADLAYDAPLRQRIADLGLVTDEAARDPDEFRLAMAHVLLDVGPRLRGLRSDPALQELMADPAVVAMVEQGNTFGLLANPKFRELVSRVASPPPGP